MESYFLSIHKGLVITIDFFAVLLGWIVYSKNPKREINKVFFIMSFFMIGWVSFAYSARLFAENLPYLALYSLRIAWFLTPLFFCGLYLLVINLTKIKKHIFLNKIIVFLGAFVSIASLFTDWVIKNFQLINSTLSIIYGRGVGLFLGYGVLLIGVTIFLLFKSYYTLSYEEKIRIQYLLVGLTIFYILNIIFNILLPVFFHKTSLYWIGDYSTILLLGLTAVAIVKRQLFGIKVILAELLISLLLILLFVDFFFSRSLVEYLWKGVLVMSFLIFGWLLIKSVIREIRYREQLQKAYEKLKILDKAKSEFVSIASHQLRTPLTAIKGYISMILEGSYGPFPRKIHTPLKNVYKSNERLIKLVNDLLNLSRIESGRIELQKKESSIEELIESVIKELKVEVKKKHIYLRFRKPKKKLPKINIDPDKIRNVILNIIDNAIRYTQEGGITVEVKAQRFPRYTSLHSIVSKQGKIRIKISDTGEGMTKEELSKIFQSFSRAGAGTRLYTEGAGLGLYIARRFVELHGGKIWAESPGRGKGSTFYIELPIK